MLGNGVEMCLVFCWILGSLVLGRAPNHFVLISLCQVVCGWYINQSMHNFVENNQLQFASSRFMWLPTEIVKHVRDAAGVSVSCLWQILQIFPGPFHPSVFGYVGMDWIVEQLSRLDCTGWSKPALACCRLRLRKPSILLDFYLSGLYDFSMIGRSVDPPTGILMTVLLIEVHLWDGTERF